MEGLQDEEELTVDEVVILMTKIFFFFGALYAIQRSLLGIVRGVRACPCCSEQVNPYQNVFMTFSISIFGHEQLLL